MRVMVTAVVVMVMMMVVEGTQTRHFVSQGGFGGHHGGVSNGPQKFRKNPFTGQYEPVPNRPIGGAFGGSHPVHSTHPVHSAHPVHSVQPVHSIQPVGHPAGLHDAFQFVQQQQLQQQQQQHQIQQQQHQLQQQQFQQQQQQFQQQLQQQQIISQQQQNQHNNHGVQNIAHLARLNVGKNKPNIAYQSCTTPSGDSGHCRHLMHCISPKITNYIEFTKTACPIEQTYIGLCCPDSFSSTQQEPKPEPQRNQRQPIILPNPQPKPQPQPNTQPQSSQSNIQATQPNTQPQTSQPNTETSQPNTQPQTSQFQSTLSSLQQKLTGNIECGKATEVIHTRIVGGERTNPGEFPWTVAIMRRGAVPPNYCGGALISTTHVITAAHCIVGFDKRDIWVRVGEHNFDISGESAHANHRILNFNTHNRFNGTNFNNDIALLTLSRPVDINGFVRPICLPKNEDYDGKMATIAGWGAILYNGPVSRELRKVQLPIWSNRDCDAAFRQTIRDTMVCAGLREGGKDACQDDSGGPMMYHNLAGGWELVGLVSFGSKCAEPGKPGVYTRITSFINWLNDIV